MYSKLFNPKTLIILILLVTACKKDPEPVPDEYSISVRLPVLKYSLIDVSYEIYQVNVSVARLDAFSETRYSSMGASAHYSWLKTVYDNFTADEKSKLNTLFATFTAWEMMNTVTLLYDSSGIETITNKLASDDNLPGNVRNIIPEFYPAFYSKYFKDYFQTQEPIYMNKVEKINKELQGKNTDILKFMEDVSGIKFAKKLKPVFYYTYRPIGAMGFETDTTKISTIQCTVTSYKYLFSTPFHEFTHSLFRTFNQNSEYLALCDKLKSNEVFYQMWINRFKNSGYPEWYNWCDENLVEGFAIYLKYKYDGSTFSQPTYYYDLQFYNFLVQNNCKENNCSNFLKNMTINFLESL